MISVHSLTTSSEFSRALPRLLGVADHPGGPADEPERPVPGVLEPPQGQDLQQVAHVQARRRRVESAIHRDRSRRHLGAQGVEVRRVRDESAPLEVVEDVLVHGRSLRRAPTGLPEH